MRPYPPAKDPAGPHIRTSHRLRAGDSKKPAAVITIGAMHTQHDTAPFIISRGAGYVMTVQARMPTLCQQLKRLPWAAIPATLT
jgi:hypothetical protein